MNISQEAKEEIELLESMYPDRFQWIDGPASDLASFRVSLSPVFGDGLEHPVEMRIVIGPEYPAHAIPRVRLRMEETNRQDGQRFSETYQAWLESERPDLEGEVCVDVLVAKVGELAAEFSPDKTKLSSAIGLRSLDAVHQTVETQDRKLTMAWTVFWMHHIKATGKRKNIVGWARELHIRGWSKPGYPGALIIDGPKAAVEEYSARLKALRWKAIQQRHFEVYELPLDESTELESAEVESHRRIRRTTTPLSPQHINNNNNDLDPNLLIDPQLQDGVIEVQSMAQLLLLARMSGFDDQVLQILKIK